MLKVWRIGSRAGYRFLYCDGTEFIVDGGGHRIWGRWRAPYTLEDAATYLLGPVIGFALRRRGVICLHASAVRVDGRALVLLGPVGSGKSTLAAAYSALGHAVLSDDLVALLEADQVFFAQPGYPRIRLWPESAAALYGSREALPRITPTWDKRFLDLASNGSRFHGEPLPVGAIYYLDRRQAEPSAPLVEPIEVRERFCLLTANTYANYLLEKEMRAREFDVLSRLVAAVPVRRVTPHIDPAGLERLCRLILEDYRQVRAAD